MGVEIPPPCPTASLCPRQAEVLPDSLTIYDIFSLGRRSSSCASLYDYAQLKKINQSCFPVTYNPSFYVDMAKKQDENLCKFAYCNGFAVGAICTRIEPIPDW